MGHFSKPDHLVLVECAYEIAALEERTVLSFQRSEVLFVVPIALALADWRLVVNLLDSRDEVVVEFERPYNDAGFLGFAHHVPRFVVTLFLKSVLLCRYRYLLSFICPL